MPRRSVLSYLLLVVLLLSACEPDNDPAFSNLIEAATFSLQTPPGWTMTPGQGYDSYVGKISGPQGVIYFDQGLSGFRGLDNIMPTDRTIYLRRTLVDGLPAVIHKEKSSVVNNDDRKVVLTLYIDANDGIRMNRLYTFNPTVFNEAVLIEIMETHRFR